MQRDDRVSVLWPSGESELATISEVIDEETIVLVFDEESEEEYQYERGVDGNWYEINNSDVPVSITVILRSQRTQ